MSKPGPMDLTDTARGLVLSRIRMVMIGVGAVAAVLVLGTWLIDEGEIVKISTVDARGRDHVTELWIVDLDSGAWLRAGAPDARWLSRIRENPEIVLERGGEELHYRAIPNPSPEARRKVNRAMSVKYGAADRFWESVSDLSDSVPIRLLPSEAPDVSH